MIFIKESDQKVLRTPGENLHCINFLIWNYEKNKEGREMIQN